MDGKQERMDKFTPGPWTLHRHAETAVVGSSGWVVAACGGYSNNSRDPTELSEELRANATLIAAAPDMYAALVRLLAPDRRSVYATPEVIEAARSALACAEGRP